MSEIPEDVMQAARRLHMTLFDHCRDTVIVGMNLKDIAHAIMDERERCARVAETSGVYPELNVFGGGPEWYQHGKQIAAEIRAGKQP